MSGAKESAPATICSYEGLLQDAIRKQRNDRDIKLKVKDVQGVVPIGENYLSTLYRVFLEISSGDRPVEEKVLVVKDLPKSEILQNFIKKDGIFKIEMLMYKNILPEMNRICSEVLLCPTLSPNFLETSDDNLQVMEDLKLFGYKMADRIVGLDSEQCRLAMRAIARIHGISVSLAQNDETILELLPRGMYKEEKIDTLNHTYRSQYANLSEVAETWPGFQRFGAKLREVSSSAAQEVVRLNNPSNTDLPVLNHGDFKLNNMMFKYSDSGEVEGIKLVDFQMAHFASPAIDLHYFLVTSPNDEVREEGFEALLEVYHSELCRVLEATGCGDKVVTLDWLKQEIKDKMFFALQTACCILSAVVAEPENIIDYSQLTDESSYKVKESVERNSFNSARYKKLLQKFLLTFEKEGLL